VTLTFDLKSSVRATCDVSYLCANFSLPRPLCSQVRPDVRDRQRRRQTKASLFKKIIASKTLPPSKFLLGGWN